MTHALANTDTLSAADATAWATMKTAEGDALRAAALTQARLHPSVGVGIMGAALSAAALPGHEAVPELRVLRAQAYARAKALDTGFRGVLRRFGAIFAAPALALVAVAVDALPAEATSGRLVTGIAGLAVATALWPIVVRATQPLALLSRSLVGQEGETARMYAQNRIALADASQHARSLAIAGVTSGGALLALGHHSAAAALIAAGIVAIVEARRLQKARLVSDGELVLLVERAAAAERQA